MVNGVVRALHPAFIGGVRLYAECDPVCTVFSSNSDGGRGLSHVNLWEMLYFN